MSRIAELVADVMDRAADGPLRAPIGAVAGALQGRDAFKLLRLACLTAFCFFPLAGWHPVGTFLISAGGSLVQVAVVFGFMAAAWFSGKRFDASLMWLWAGLNFLDVSVYAGDARNRALPLIFGMDKAGHDWGNMLAMTGLLGATPAIAGALWLLGTACFGMAVAMGVRTAELD